MPRDTNGTYTPPSGSWYPAVDGQDATPDDWNALIADESTALTQSINTQGTAQVVADIPFSGHKLTNVGDGSASDDAATYGQLAGYQPLATLLTVFAALAAATSTYPRFTSASTMTVDSYATVLSNIGAITASSSDTLTNKTLTSPTINGGTIQSRVQTSSETTGSLTSASANKAVACSGGVTLANSVFTAGDMIIFDPGTSDRTFTRGSGVTMYVFATDSATATLAANRLGFAYWRSASVVVLSGAFT